MSDNYTIVQQPKRWASAHKPIRFFYDMPFQIGDIDNSGGFANVLLSLPLAGGKTIVVGDLIYIDTNPYIGYHVVKSVSNNLDFVLETAYVSFAANATVKYGTPPQWQIWKGYLDSEVIGFNFFPFTKVADFAPEAGVNGLLEFDIMGYVKSAMAEILESLEGTSIGGGAFLENEITFYTPYRLLIGVNPESLYFENIYMALNSSIESDTLNAEYLNTDKALNTNAFINSCGTTFLSFLGTNGVTTLRLEGELPVSTGEFNNDFNNDFFNE